MKKPIQMELFPAEEDLVAQAPDNRYIVNVSFTVCADEPEDARRYIEEKIQVMLNADLEEFEDIKYSKYNPDRGRFEHEDIDKDDDEGTIPRISSYDFTDINIAEVY